MYKINSTPDSKPASAIRAADRLHRDLATAVISFHEVVARQLGMSAAERKTLGILCELGLTTPGKLAQATGLTTGAITGIIDRLEKAGYAKREANPDDRRSLLVRPLQLEKLAKIIPPSFAGLSTAMAELSGRYTPEQLEVIHGYLAATTQVLIDEAQKLKGKKT